MIKNQDYIKEKVFVPCESLITQLCENKNIRSLWNIFISVFILCFINLVVGDLVNNGQVDLGGDWVLWCFKGFGSAFMLWLAMKMCTLFLVYYGLKLWHNLRSQTCNKSPVDKIFLAIYIIYNVSLFILPILVINRVSYACRWYIMFEQLRLLMKGHSFVRENIVKILNYETSKQKTDDDNPKQIILPNISKYVYFLFAPTLIYRDEYPRTEKIRWSFVLKCFLELLAILFVINIILYRWLILEVRGLYGREIVWSDYFLLISKIMVVMPALKILVFYYLFHVWQNMFAEFLRFADRKFYSDWWNSYSLNSHWRTWNIIVHDWLYIYVHGDVYKLLGRKYKSFCIFFAMFVSGIFHEYIVLYTAGYNCPIMLILYVLMALWCVLTVKSDSAAWNICLLTGIVTGLSVNVAIVAIEGVIIGQSRCENVDRKKL